MNSQARQPRQFVTYAEQELRGEVLDTERRKEAIAVVDAAIMSNWAHTGAEVPEEFRSLLVESVLQDPTFTESLFNGEAFRYNLSYIH